MDYIIKPEEYEKAEQKENKLEEAKAGIKEKIKESATKPIGTSFVDTIIKGV